MTITYKTHILLGCKAGGCADEVKRWEYVPSGKEVTDAVNARIDQFNEFVLVAAIGSTYVGTYSAPNDCCG